MKKLLVLSSVLFAGFTMACAQNSVEIQVDFEQPVMVSSFLTGITHTQSSIDPWDNAGAVADAKILLRNTAHFQNQHIMGWGTLNPWPDSTITDPANWNWTSLDNRINLIRETGGIPVITLCGSPTWMHTPSKNGETLWDKIETAPTPDHFDEFAHLCAVVARRYPDVLHFQVWNELKGFWNTDLNRWRYEDYTLMYNMIYDSLKAVNTNIKVGGPYPVVSTYSSQKSFTSTLGGEYGYFDKRPLDVIAYWLEHKKGGDFIAIDGKTKNKDEIWNTSAFKSADKFADIINWIRQQPNGGADLEIWWSEWYAYPRADDPVDEDFYNALMTSSLIKSIKGGSATVLVWQPEGDKNGFSFPLGIWTSTDNAGGGKPTAFYDTYRYLKDHFSRGTEIVKTVYDPDKINVLAAADKILLVNQQNADIIARISGHGSVALDPYEVKLVDPSTLVTDIQISEHDNIKIFYNKERRCLNFVNFNPVKAGLKYRIFDVMGKTLVMGEFTPGSEGNTEIEIKGIPNGLYFYEALYHKRFYKGRFLFGE